MNQSVSKRICPAILRWSETASNLDPVPLDTTSLRLTASTKNFARLRDFKQLKSLWCFNINARALEHICDCTSLENLFIEGLKSESISSLRKLNNMKVLSIETCMTIDSLIEFSSLQSLEGLAIIHFRNVEVLDPLAQLTGLEQLAVAGSMWTRMKIESLGPLAALRGLKYLDLTNLKAVEESLRPIGEMTELELLEIANFYPMEEFAWLAGRLKGTECTWFKPYIQLPFECKRCHQRTMVMLSGKGKPKLCTNCDAERLARHVAVFEELANAARHEVRPILEI